MEGEMAREVWEVLVQKRGEGLGDEGGRSFVRLEWSGVEWSSSQMRTEVFDQASRSE
jgi:hypothetical protein